MVLTRLTVDVARTDACLRVFRFGLTAEAHIADIVEDVPLNIETALEHATAIVCVSDRLSDTFVTAEIGTSLPVVLERVDELVAVTVTVRALVLSRETAETQVNATFLSVCLGAVTAETHATAIVFVRARAMLTVLEQTGPMFLSVDRVALTALAQLTEIGFNALLAVATALEQVTAMPLDVCRSIVVAEAQVTLTVQKRAFSSATVTLLAHDTATAWAVALSMLTVDEHAIASVLVARFVLLTLEAHVTATVFTFGRPKVATGN